MAEQQSVTVQVVGTAVQAATTLETQPSSSSTAEGASGVTQIQIGCVLECFGTTNTNSSPAAVIQQFLSDLGSLAPGCGSSSPQTTPAPEQSVIDLVACQVQSADTAASQTQVASQSATTVQVTDTTPASEAPPPPAVAGAQQGTWQLQIGCVFHCVDTQQVQQAQQSITIITVQTGPAGSSPDPVDVTNQIIWQVQVGCVAWCYDATQVQLVTGQSTVLVDESPPLATAPPPSGSAPSSTPPTPVPGDPPQAPPSPGRPGVSSTITPSLEVPPRRINSPALPVRLLGTIAEAGSGMLSVTAPVTWVRVVAVAIAPAVTGDAPTGAAHLSIDAAPHANARPGRRASGRPLAARQAPVSDAISSTPVPPTHFPMVALLLIGAATLAALALFDKSAR